MMMPTSATGSKPLLGLMSLRRSAEHGFMSLRRSAEHGFTLVELLIVMAIIGVLSAVVVLQLSSSRAAPLTEARTVVSVLKAAQTRAVIDARAIRVRFGDGAPVAEQRRKTEWVTIPAKQSGLANWPRNVAVAPAALVFDPSGTIFGPSEVTLSRGGEIARVLIDTEGTIRVAE
jgi:general secretion pathway protein H